MAENSDMSRKAVVFTKFKLKLVNSYRVVFVYYWYNIVGYQSFKGVLNVIFARSIQNISRQKYLCHRKIVFAEKLVVHIHQFALPHSSARLLHRRILGAFGQAHFGHSQSYGARRHKYDLLTAVLNVRQYLYKLFHSPYIKSASFMGKCGCTYFYHYPFFSIDIKHDKRPFFLQQFHA